MQTFLPYVSFVESARCLDRARLGKQRVECLQLLNALLNPGTSRWENHPAALMWKGHEGLLAMYGIAICSEWKNRGYNDSCMAKIEGILETHKLNNSTPSWLGDKRLHSSHRSNLLRKDPEWYGKFAWEESPNMEYWWPVRKGGAR